MIIISYVTRNTPYVKVLNQYLLPSLKKFNLKYDIEEVKDKGSWSRNTHMKAEFIKRKLLEHKESVTFLDSDAEILKYPSLLYELDDFNLGLHFLDWHKHWHDNNKKTRFDALSGTLFINYSENSFNFLNDWIKYNKYHSQWEQRNMAHVLGGHSHLKTAQLPYSYITVVNHQNGIPKHMISEEDVVILHNQCSRKLKNRQNWHKSS